MFHAGQQSAQDRRYTVVPQRERLRRSNSADEGRDGCGRGQLQRTEKGSPMSTGALFGVLVIGILVLTPLSGRLGLPQPVVLTLFGVGLAQVPGVPEVQVDPEHILPAVLPPLLFAATLRTSATEFRRSAGAVLALAVGLTAATAVVVAVVAHLVGLPWGPAAVLGAVVSPPDPVAATSISRRLRLPGRLVTVLEGEGLFNDATALVLFQVAVAAVVAGSLSAGEVVLELVVAIVGGVGLGLLAGVVVRWLLALLTDPAAETTLTLAAPYAVYLGAERLHVSGVLAVLLLGLYLRSRAAHRALTSRGWLDGRAVWRYADFALTSLAFAFVGLELSEVLGRVDAPGETLPVAALVLATIVVTRAVWVAAVSATAAGVRRRRDSPLPYGWREATVVSWSGMRGVVTVATALALPLQTDAGGAFPNRDAVVLVGLAVVLVTLVGQGLTLGPLVRRLGVGSEEDERAVLQELRGTAAAAACQRLHELRDDGAEPAAVDVVLERYAALQRLPLLGGGHDDEQRLAVMELSEQALDAERTAVLDARRHGDVSAEASDAMLAEVEARALR